MSPGTCRAELLINQDGAVTTLTSIVPQHYSFPYTLNLLRGVGAIFDSLLADIPAGSAMRLALAAERTGLSPSLPSAVNIELQPNPAHCTLIAHFRGDAPRREGAVKQNEADWLIGRALLAFRVGGERERPTSS